jgi:hypothetical protein
MVITIIQGLIFILYVSFLLVRFKKPLPSISDSWYELPDPINNLFTLFCWSIGFLMFFQMDGSTPFFFFSGAGLCFTGTATMFRLEKSTEQRIHFIGAAACVFFALIGLLVERHYWLPMIFVCLGIFWCTSENFKNKIWWIEIVAFISIFIGLLTTS